MQMMRKLLHHPDLAQYLQEETVPGPRVRMDEEMLDFVKKNGSTGYHLVGTAGMGAADDPLGGRRRSASRPWRPGAAYRGRVGDADDPVGEHVCGVDDDRGKASDLIKGRLEAA